MLPTGVTSIVSSQISDAFPTVPVTRPPPVPDEVIRFATIAPSSTEYGLSKSNTASGAITVPVAVPSSGIFTTPAPSNTWNTQPSLSSRRIVPPVSV
jgi:hypothetical protein